MSFFIFFFPLPGANTLSIGPNKGKERAEALWGEPLYGNKMKKTEGEKDLYNKKKGETLLYLASH